MSPGLRHMLWALCVWISLTSFAPQLWAVSGYATEESLQFESEIYLARIDFALQRLDDMAALIKDEKDSGAWGALADPAKKRMFELVDEIRENNRRLPQQYYLEIELLSGKKIWVLREDIQQLKDRYTRTRGIISFAFAQKTLTQSGISDQTLGDIAAGIELRRSKNRSQDDESQLSAWLERIKSQIMAWLQNLFPQGDDTDDDMGQLEQALTWLAFTMFILLAIVLLWLLYKLVRGMFKKDGRRQVEQKATPLYPELQKLTGSSYWKQALDLMEDDDLREALRMFFHAWMHMLHDSFDSPMPWVDETNREWLKRASEKLPPQVQADTSRMARLFDRHWYGMRQPDREDVAHYRDTLQDIIGGGGGS